MAELPVPVRDFIDALTDELLAPAYLLVDDEGALRDWGGALDSYGIAGLHEKQLVAEHLNFLGGILPVDAGGVFLPNVQTRDDVFADIYFFHRQNGTWILFLDATVNVKKRQQLQQRAYDVSLRAADLEQEGKALYDVNSMLEQRVREQTAELSQTVVRLQQELAETKKTHKALSLSESRLKSLFDGNLIGIVFWNSSGKITSANDAFLDLVGYTKADLASGIIQWNRISPTERPGVSELDETLEFRPHQPNERDFIRKDGRRITLLFISDTPHPPSEQSFGFASKPTK